MRMLWQVIAILAVVHLVALAGLAGWLVGTQRVDRARLAAVAQLFTQTIEQEKAATQQADAVAREAQQQTGRVELAKFGPAAALSLDRQIAQQRQHDDLQLRRLERTRQDLESLRHELDLEQAKVQKQHADLLVEKQQLETQIKTMRSQLSDAGFKRTVALYEQLPPKQAKQMFIDLMGENRTDDVVNYLEGMEPRKAAAVLKEFKTPAETQLAVLLTQKLRSRGRDVGSSPSAPGTRSAGANQPSKPESVG